MDSQLTRDINPNKYVTTIRRGLIGLELGPVPGVVNCELVNTLTVGETGNFLICQLLKMTFT
jgi:hypothetical protein